MIDDLSIENQSYDAQAQLFKVLTHPARLAILSILRDGEHCVCHMEAHLGFRQAYISQQLAVLREAGLIQDRRDGWNIFYRVADPQIYTILDAVQTMLGEATLPRPKEDVHCPCPKCNCVAAA
ncbi:MAG TPA: metalloregulator ArsR/SmtB family transcription factor [Anaerolineaceae bacterium]